MSSFFPQRRCLLFKGKMNFHFLAVLVLLRVAVRLITFLIGCNSRLSSWLFQDCKFYHRNTEYFSNPKYLEDLQVMTFNESDNSKCNISARSLVDFQRILLTICVSEKSSPASGDYDRIIMRSSVDICSLTKGIWGNFFSASLLQRMQQYSNLTLGCPLEKGFYYAVNYPILNDEIVPTRLFGRFDEWRNEMIFKGKVKGVRPLVHVFTMRFNIFRRMEDHKN